MPWPGGSEPGPGPGLRPPSAPAGLASPAGDILSQALVQSCLQAPLVGEAWEAATGECRNEVGPGGARCVAPGLQEGRLAIAVCLPPGPATEDLGLPWAADVAPSCSPQPPALLAGERPQREGV